MHHTAYSFLDPAKNHGLVAAYVFGIALGECIVFAIVRYAIVFRERWAVRSGRVSSTTVNSAGASGAHNRDNSTTILSMTQRTRSLDTGTETAAKASGKDVDVQEDWEEVHIPEQKLSLQSSRSMVGPDKNDASTAREAQAV